jgi:hypothetical protein
MYTCLAARSAPCCCGFLSYLCMGVKYADPAFPVECVIELPPVLLRHIRITCNTHHHSHVLYIIMLMSKCQMCQATDMHSTHNTKNARKQHRRGMKYLE